MTTLYFDAPGGPEIPRFEATDLAARNVKWRLFRHIQAPRTVSESWLLNDGSYTTTQPADPATIVLHVRSGRTAITPAQASRLLQAGETVILPDQVTPWDPSVGLTWAEASQLTWGDLVSFPWSLL